MKQYCLLILLVPVLFLSGCQTVTYDNYFSESYMYSRWLPALEENKSTRYQIHEKVGLPSRSFEGGRIVTYRIMINEWKNGLSDTQFKASCLDKYQAYGRIEKLLADKRFERLDKEGALLVITEANKDKYEKEIIAGIVEYHLVLVFDAVDGLKKHSLVRIQP